MLDRQCRYVAGDESVGNPLNAPHGAVRVRLHSGLSGGAKAVLGVGLMACAVIGVPVLGLIAGAFSSLARPGAGWIAGPLVAVVFAVPLILRLLWLFRSAAWLERTILVVRGALTTRRCDLAAAMGFGFDIVGESTSMPVSRGVLVVSTGRRIPRLIAYDAGTGRRVRLKLVDPATRQWFTPPKLYALADAILAGRGPAPDGSAAWQAAAALRAMAADPAGPLR
jgi:hypothetical protein